MKELTCVIQAKEVRQNGSKWKAMASATRGKRA